MNTPIFILGTGGQARDVADIVEAIGHRPVFVTRDRTAIESWTRSDEVVHEDDATIHVEEAFAIGIGDNRTRAAVAARLASTLRFPSLVHPDACFGRGSREAIAASLGTIVFAGVRITGNLRIGRFATINLSATLSHDVELGDFSNISPGAHIAGNVRIGEGAWIGIGAAINQGTETQKLDIGAWTTVGSGAVVVRDCDSNSTYVGVPARKLK